MHQHIEASAVIIDNVLDRFIAVRVPAGARRKAAANT
jgi:hypothetical protein